MGKVERIEKISKTNNKKQDYQHSRKSKKKNRKVAEEKETLLSNKTKKDSDTLGKNLDVIA